MPDPSFNSVNFFGPCPTSRRVEPPNARQLNAFPGIAGVESIELGSRVSFTEFEGIWYVDGSDDSGLGAFIAGVIATKRNGGFGTLVDTHGITSQDAVFETFETVGMTIYAPGFGWTQEYRIRFLHLGFNLPGGSVSASAVATPAASPSSTSAFTPTPTPTPTPN